MPHSQPESITPVRRQYLEVKRRYPHAIVFFRLGDFYETFDDDARTCARELEITLTSKAIGKNQRVPLAGVPYHAIDGYLTRLIARGYKVAVCDQIGDAASARGMIERRVTRVVTPGTVVEDGLLDGSRNNYLVAVAAIADRSGIAHTDVSTGEFRVTCLPLAEVRSELQRLGPAEVLLVGTGLPPIDDICDAVTLLDEQALSERAATERLLAHFQSATLQPYGCADLPPAICAAAAVLRYLDETQPEALSVITRLSTYNTDQYMALDAQTVRNLELFESGRGGGRSGSLLDAIDATRTPMGGRLLRQRLGQPLLDPASMSERLDVVEWFCSRAILRDRLLTLLSRVPDLDRLLTRASTSRASPREVMNLGLGLRQCLSVSGLLGSEADALPFPLPGTEGLQEAASLIESAIAEAPPAALDAGGTIREGYSAELDGYRSLAGDARGYLAALEQRERERTGLRSLKVGYNKVFGYYIEVSNAHRVVLPPDYQRRQTLVGAERYTTEDLKEHESRVLGAQERIEELESSLFRSVCAQIAAAGDAIRRWSATVAELDVSVSFAELASQRGYVRPVVDDSDIIMLRRGRHPVVESVLAAGAFVPNDTDMDASNAQIVLLTGPNMAGKSTYLRQVALIVLLAQIGCFVPAEAAHIGTVDRIFTRVGAQDDLAAGNSTFMVEMVEAAQILAHATPRSLIILDEVGRGTSTYDGLAIAQAIVEYLHNRQSVAARTIFATHYHELVGLSRTLPRVRNFNVAVAEEEGAIVFLRTIVPGGADRSYGIHVAQLAGLPRSVTGRAREILNDLEAMKEKGRHGRPTRTRPVEGLQLNLLAPRHPLIEALAELDVDSLSPLEAIQTLYELRQRARE